MTARFNFISAPQALVSEAPVAELAPLVFGPRSGIDTGTDAAQPLAPELTSEEVFIPEGYEPNYAYPLVVWLLEAEDSTGEFHRRMQHISTRNYVGAALPGLSEVIDDVEAFSQLQTRLQDLVLRIRRVFNIHTERVYLAGFGSQGSAALRLCLARPEWIAGAIVAGGQLPATPRLLYRFRELRGKRVLFACGQHDPQAPVTEILRSGRLLHSAGLRIAARWFDSGHELTRNMLLEVDRWLMAGVHQSAHSR